MNKNVILTIKKELRSVFRDKKTLRNIFLIPFLIPLMIFLYGYMFDSVEKTDKVYDIGINYEPNDYEKMSYKDLKINYKIMDNKDDLDKEYKNKNISAYILYDENNNKYTIYCDESDNGMVVSSILEKHFEGYNKYLTNNNLIEKGIDVDKVFNNLTL